MIISYYEIYTRIRPPQRTEIISIADDGVSPHPKREQNPTSSPDWAGTIFFAMFQIRWYPFPPIVDLI